MSIASSAPRVTIRFFRSHAVKRCKRGPEPRRLRFRIAIDGRCKCALDEGRIGILIGVEPDRIRRGSRIVGSDVEWLERDDLGPREAFGERAHAAISRRASAARACPSSSSIRARVLAAG